jgi:C4-dicarboxylate-specific signal transduction histidine kinase
MSGDPIIIFFLIRYLRSSLKMQTNIPQWDKLFRFAMYGSLVLLCLEALVPALRQVISFVAIATLAGLAYILYNKPEFKQAKQVLIAVAPYIAVSIVAFIIKLIPSVFSKWHGALDNLELFTVIWFGGVWFLTIRQRKELEKTQKKIEEEQENNKIISAMKAELEVQVEERTAALRKQKEELEIALEELKSTQSQLIQSEKMASLGELTAGIAHEIQNPLNFVNNFSEVNNELIEELKAEGSKLKEEEQHEILNDILQNNEKIAFHGKRADAIVKSMLQHSRKSTGQKELTDMNALCNEYLRLSYHGLRAKDKTFNAKLETSLAADLPQINVIAQDISRVLLNLFTNAFYSVHQKKKALGDSYDPIVSVSTALSGNSIQINVRDNGTGIPKNVMDKIYQPFFTTKPTGEGTGLGLSLSYDIVTKVHGGSIQANTTEGEYAEFIILLPINK